MRIGELISEKKYFDDVTPEDLEISRTLKILVQQTKLTATILTFVDIHLVEKERLCDLGCGAGFIPYFIGNSLRFKETYGVDINDERIVRAQKRLTKVVKADLETDALPFPDKFFDLVSSFGVLEHLKFFDNAIKESHRILKNGGLLLISIPNLSDWVNRVRLLLGLQPHSIVVSQISNEGVDHIHSCTLETLEKLMRRYSFTPLVAYGAKADFRSNRLLEILDSVFSKKPSMSHRFFSISRKIG